MTPPIPLPSTQCSFSEDKFAGVFLLYCLPDFLPDLLRQHVKAVGVRKVKSQIHIPLFGNRDILPSTRTG